MKLIDVVALKREERSIAGKMKVICEAAVATESRRMTDAQGIEYCTLEKELEELRGRIETAERSNAIVMDERNNDDSNSNDNDDTNNHKDEKRFETFGTFLQAVRSASTGRVDPRLIVDGGEKRASTGFNETIPSDGGYLVQQDHLAGIQKRIYEKGLIAGKCSKIGIGPNSNGMTWLELDEKSRKDGFRNGGIRAYWAAEADTVAPSSAKMMKKHLDLQKLMALAYTTEELLQDSTALESWIAGIVDDELAFQLDEAILGGSGAGVPLGWSNSDATITIDKEVGQAAGSIVYENLINMRSRLWARSRAKSIWYINQDCEKELQTMAMAVGTGGVPVYMPASGLVGTPYDSLFGRPVIPTEHNKTVGTIGDIWLVDPSQYRLIDKGGVKQTSSMHVRFVNDEQVFKFTYRVNGTPLWSTALTPKNGINTLSPFINLATRA